MAVIWLDITGKIKRKSLNIKYIFSIVRVRSRRSKEKVAFFL